MADLLFAACFAADVARRGAGVLTGAWLVTATAGSYPEGLAYEVAAGAPAWIALTAVASGLAWLVQGFRRSRGDRGQVVYGLFLVVVGVVLTPMIFLSFVNLWTGG